MRRRLLRQRRVLTLGTRFWLFLIAATLLPWVGVSAATFTLKNGMQFIGEPGKQVSVLPSGKKLKNGNEVAGVVLADDKLVRAFFAQHQVRDYKDSAGPALERVLIRDKKVARKGRRVTSVGQIVADPFDQFGNRLVRMSTSRGRINVVMGITEITPVYVRIQGLAVQRNSFVWDMRVNTKTIDRKTLNRVLARHIKMDNPDERLRLVRLYTQAGRIRDAHTELRLALDEFPQLRKMQNLRNQVDALRQLEVNHLIDEIQTRRDAGQHRLAQGMLRKFPKKHVAGVLLQKVQDMIDEYDKTAAKKKTVVTKLKRDYDALADKNLQQQCRPILNEMARELYFNNINRMADYLRLADDKKLTPKRKLALAISGWLVAGGDEVTDNLAVALSLVDVRLVVRQYLNSDLQTREGLLTKLKELEGSTPNYVSKIIANMIPTKLSTRQAGRSLGNYELTVPGLTGDPDIRYEVQLPPEYDPHRRYPCIVALHGPGSTPSYQIDWWCGKFNARVKFRLGEATRRGFIVVAPKWSEKHQTKYKYSAREHSVVLNSLRDACRRFSVNTDRVFLTGHSAGGDAAWDIGLAHPDLWAGVVPIVATARKYVTRYDENGRLLPMYFVAGQLDGSRIEINSRHWDRYLTRHTYNVVIIEYQGRGHEHFHEEQHRIMDWMTYQKPRDVALAKFEAKSMRTWDNFFWWVELDQFPIKTMVAPIDWESAKKATPAFVRAQIHKDKNTIVVRSAAKRISVSLNPDIADFKKPVLLILNGRRFKKIIKADIVTMLEDVRTRADRQHPFWAVFRN